MGNRVHQKPIALARRGYELLSLELKSRLVEVQAEEGMGHISTIETQQFNLVISVHLLGASHICIQQSFHP